MDAYLLFAGIWFAAAAAPGADTLLILTTSVAAGWRKALIASAGIAAAKVILLLMAYFGLASLISAFPITFIALKIFGVSFLLWKAFRMWIKSPQAGDRDDSRAANFVPAFLVGISNPQAWMFYIAVVPAVALQTNPAALSAIIGFGFMAIGACYAGLAQPIRRLTAKPRNQLVVNRVVAVIFVALAIVIALR